jgi:cytochrome c551
VIPAVLLLLVSGTVFVLAELHPAKADEPARTAPSAGRGPVQRGQQVFADNCASCHETGVGPELNGSGISIAAAREQIVNGGGGMPANLVQGQDLDDVLAYLETIL